MILSVVDRHGTWRSMKTDYFFRPDHSCVRVDAFSKMQFAITSR